MKHHMRGVMVLNPLTLGVFAGDADLRSQVTNTQVMRSILSYLGATHPNYNQNDGTGLLKPDKLFHRGNDVIGEVRRKCKDAVDGKL